MNKKKILYTITVVLMITGISIIAYPYIEQWRYSRGVDVTVREFDSTSIILHDKNEDKKEEEKTTTKIDLSALHEEMEAYNEKLHKEGQSGLKDAWSYEESSFELSKWGLKDDMIGYLEIPDISLKVPIYLGANAENMRLGAVHMSQTSLPIGGDNSNSVIAAHRGYYRAQMFRNIDRLDIGDSVYVTNLWGTLRYRISETKVIRPDQVDQVLIREGKDMVTLITCHPFPYDYQRYVVYCEYDGQVEKEEKAEVEKDISSSNKMLYIVNTVTDTIIGNKVMSISIAVIVITGFCAYRIRKRRKRRIDERWDTIRKEQR